MWERGLRPISADPGGHRFLLKALGEAGNELAEALLDCPRRLIDRCGPDGWSVRLIAVHVEAHEEMVAGYIERMLHERNPELDVIDSERVLDDPDACRRDPERAAMGFVHGRRQTQYLLWDLDDDDWQRAGRHPYRGSITIVQLARELHLHDIEYMLRVNKLKDQDDQRQR